jgi:ABC-type transport system involved in multi-copper enzyme maturation permease subunit
MNSILSVADATFRETVRRRVFFVSVAFAVLIFITPLIAIPLASGQRDTLVKDIGLSFIDLFGVLLAVLMVTSLVHDEIDRKTVYTVLARPIRRRDYVAGKYLGLLLMSAANLGIMAVAFVAILAAVLGRVQLGLFASVALSFLQVSVITAFALLFTTISTPLIATIGSLFVFIAGHLLTDVQLFASRFAGPVGGRFLEATTYVLPNLSHFDAKGEFVYGSGVRPEFLLLALAYAACYCLLVLLLTALAFEKREFK